MVSNQSVSSPTQETKKGKGKKKVNIGPFSPPMKEFTQLRTPITRRMLQLGASPSTVPETPSSNEEQTQPKNEAILISSSTSVSSFTRTRIQLDRRLDGGMTSLEEKLASLNNVVASVECKKTEEALTPPTQRVQRKYGWQGYPKVAMNIIFHSGDPEDIGIAYPMFPDSNFRIPMKDYDKKIDAQTHQIILKKDKGNTDIQMIDTPEGLGLSNGDKIVVRGVNPMLNTDTRFKQITIKDMVDECPKFLQLLCPLTRTLYDIHQEWATFTGTDIDSFAFLCKGKPIDRLAIVGDEEIFNGSKFYTVDPAALSPF